MSPETSPGPGSRVRSIDNPGRVGMVTNAPPREQPSGTYFQVRWDDGGVDFLHTDELEVVIDAASLDPLELAEKGRYGRAADLRRALTHVHLSGRLANLVYAMGVTNTEFYPHQYRPLLTLLDSPVTGLLIADEVGLGKTIEAGLIWTELRARYDFRKLVVVCPAMLREKWRDELVNRFGVDTHIVDAAGLLDAIDQPSHRLGEGRAWVISYQSARPPRHWRPERSAPDTTPNARWRLADRLSELAGEDAVFDLVVFDEAHYMRNRETATWRLGRLMKDVADHQLMLSATPINLRNRDLFNLLQLLDPEHFSTEYDLESLLQANQPLVAARDAALDLSRGSADILARLRAAAENPLLSESKQLRALLDPPPTSEQLARREFRAELAETLERVNLLSHVVTRTRKRDVQLNRVTRAVRRHRVTMSALEQQLYATITDALRDYASKHDINEGFLLAGVQRQFTSCPAAVVETWLGKEDSARQQMLDDLEEEAQASAETADLSARRRPLRQVLERVIPSTVQPSALRECDTKFAQLLQALRRFFGKHPEEKVIVFTTFRATARYLSDRLAEVGFPALLVRGGAGTDKQDVIKRFRSDDSIRVLVSTDVAAEGVDLQFCRVLVNYDLPWNPTRIEQRIGRIDRLGQDAPRILIWNLYFADTIDDRIVSRLFSRLRVFEEALGEAEPVVGQEIQRLESALFRRRLTPEEEKKEIERAALALENVRRQREELERNAAHMMAHGQRVLERVEAARELAQRVTRQDLFTYVRDYLQNHWPGHVFEQSPADPMRVTIKLPTELSKAFEEFLRQQGLGGRSSLASGRPVPCIFLNKIAEPVRRQEEVIHQLHPLVRYINKDLEQRSEHMYPLVAIRVAVTDLKRVVAEGCYAFWAVSWSFAGVREEEHLAVAAADVTTGDLLEDEAADHLLQVARARGRDWLEASSVLDPRDVQHRFQQARDTLMKRYEEALRRKQLENEDRARVKLDSIDRYWERQHARLSAMLEEHRRAGHRGPARMTEGKIRKLDERMELQRKRTLELAEVRPARNFVCAGAILVEG